MALITISTRLGPLVADERGDGPAVLLLPSGAHTRDDYDGLRAALGDDVRTIALDWPAHGDSPPPPNGADTGVEDFAGAVRDAAEALALDDAVVVGNSIGGYCAARLALDRPDLVRAVVLIDSGGFDGRSLKTTVFCALMGRKGFLARIYPQFSARYTGSRTPVARAARERALATVASPAGRKVVADLWSTFSSDAHDLRARVGELRLPVLVVWGRKDPVLPLKVGRRLAGELPDGRLLELDTAHLPYLDHPAEVATAVAALLPRRSSTHA